MCAAQATDLTKTVKYSPLRCLDLSKENMPPQSAGKKNFPLGLPMKNQADFKCQQLNKDKENFERLLQSYNGVDPLKPRYDYISWIEHNYQNYISDTKYILLLEDAIRIFKDDIRYKQDTRFIEILVKYVELQHDQVDLYQTLFSQGLGTLCSMLYISWADALDRINDYSRANQVYETGIRYSAQPLEQLKRAQENFQLNLGRRMLQPQIVSPRTANTTCNRQVLSKFQKPTQMLSNRVIHGKSMPLHNTNCESRISVYKGNNDGDIATFCQNSETLNNSLASNKVNSHSAETSDNNSSISSNLKNPFKSAATPKFHVHTDNNDEVGSRVLPVISSVLKPMKRIELSKIFPLALFEPPDPKKKAMYPKEQVYAGGKELQLEELKARLYLKKYEENQLRLHASQIIPENIAGVNESDKEFTNILDNSKLLSKTDISLQKLSHLQTSRAEHKYLVNSYENPSNLTLEKNGSSTKSLSQMMSVNCSGSGVTKHLTLFNGSDDPKNLSDKDNDNNPLDLSQHQSVLGDNQRYNLLKKNKDQQDLSYRIAKSDSLCVGGDFQFKESSINLNRSKLNHSQEQHFSTIEKQNTHEITSVRDLHGKKEFCKVDDDIRQDLLTNIKEGTLLSSLGSESTIPNEKTDNGYQCHSDDTMDTFTSSQIHKPFQVSYEYLKNEQSEYFNASCNQITKNNTNNKEINRSSSDSSAHNESINSKRLIDWKPDISANKIKPILMTNTSVGTIPSQAMENNFRKITEDNSFAQGQGTDDRNCISDDKYVVSDARIPDAHDLPAASGNGNDSNTKEGVRNGFLNYMNLGKKEDNESSTTTLQNQSVDKMGSKMKSDVKTVSDDKLKNIACSIWKESHSESKSNINSGIFQNKSTFENVTLSSNTFSSASLVSDSKELHNKSHVDQSVSKCNVSHENHENILSRESDPIGFKRSNTIVQTKYIDELKNGMNSTKNGIVNCKLKSAVTDIWNDSDSEAETECKFKMTSQQKDSSGEFKITFQQKESPDNICKYSGKDSYYSTMSITKDTKSKCNDGDKTGTSGILNEELKGGQTKVDNKILPQNVITKTSYALEGNDKKLIEDNVFDSKKLKNIVNNIWNDSDSEDEMRVKSKISCNSIKDRFSMLKGGTNENSSQCIMPINKASSVDYFNQPSTSKHNFFDFNQQTTQTELNGKYDEIYSNKVNNEPYLMKEEITSQVNSNRSNNIGIHQDCGSNIKNGGNIMNVDSTNHYCKFTEDLGKEKPNYSHILLKSNDQDDLCTQRSFIDAKERRTECEKQISSDPCQDINSRNNQIGATILNPMNIANRSIYKDNVRMCDGEQLRDEADEEDSFTDYHGEMTESFPVRNDSYNFSIGNPLVGNYPGNNSESKINFDVDEMFKEYEDHETSDVEDQRRYQFDSSF